VLDQVHGLEDLAFLRDDILICEGTIETGIVRFMRKLEPKWNDTVRFGGVIELSINNKVKRRRMVLYGIHGVITIDLADSGSVLVTRFDQRDGYQGRARDGQITERHPVSSVTGLENAVSRFYETAVYDLKSNGISALAVNEALERILHKDTLRDIDQFGL
jgi:hypothetical protein